MGLLNRVMNVFRSKANKVLDEVENPIELLEQKVRDMQQSYNDAKLNSADVVGNNILLERQINDLKKESKDLDEKVKLAMSKNNEELAKKALAKKLEIDKRVSILEVTFTNNKEKVDILKKNLETLQQKIEETQRYKEEAKARMSNAEASEKVNEILADVVTKTNSIQISAIEEKISKKEARAEGLSKLQTKTLDDEFKELDTVNLDVELEKYKI